MFHDLLDTIAAIATPPGEGGIGIIRVSGPVAVPVVEQVFRSSRGRDIQQERQRVYHGHIVDGTEVLDEVLVHVMRAPATFTRQDVVEINGHGGMVPLNAVLDLLLRTGVRLAAPGEFTFRAFLNGRIDLVQAEAVIDQVQARTRAGLRAANAAAGGTLSREIFEIRQVLADALARVEAAVDFPEEDLGELVDPALIEQISLALDRMRALLESADTGRLVREGAAIVLAGKPNVGKSSLFNALLRENRAIVTPHAGTTRDRIEEYLSIGGVPVRLVDMAGVRDTDDEIERIGVDRAREALEGAQLALLVLEAQASPTQDDFSLARELERLKLPTILVLNKTDLALNAPAPPLPCPFLATVRISALTGQGLSDLEQSIARLLLKGGELDATAPMLSRLHQKDSLRRAVACIARLLEDVQVSPEFLALELQQALAAIGEITGETTPDDLLETIFSSFCIGK